MALSSIFERNKRRKVSESSTLFDVFINHRGADVKQTLATQLYKSLQQLGIRTFLDSEEKELGISFPSTIEAAIRSAKVHIAIFSKRYAESPWCLAELVLMSESKAKIIPVFYEVKPSDLRHIETGVYAEAFIKYKEKGRYLDKLNEWKEALHSLSLVAGEEFTGDCKNIICTVQKEVQSKKHLHVATYPVGLNNLVEDFERRCLEELVQDFETQCGLEENKDDVKIVGIFGMGGSGKTTLAKELFNRKKLDYLEISFLFDVREASVRGQLSSLQHKLLDDLFSLRDLKFTSTEEGTSYLKDSFGRNTKKSFLIVVDDIDHVEQLNALRIMDILNNSGSSLVIVTTRDVGVLKTAGITVGYNLEGMGRNDGRELFCWHAFGRPSPSYGYEDLVSSFVDVCGGLPLFLQVLGRHVHGRSKDYWRSELIEARKALPKDVKQRLKISFDALNAEEKQVFMDVACFFRANAKSIAERVWEGSGWNAQHALEILNEKCLVDKIESNTITMHDHLRDLGREMAHELSPPHRLWRPQDLKYLESMGLKTILSKANIRCFHSFFDELLGSLVTFFLGKPDSWFETSASLLWLELEGNLTEEPSIPSWIPLQNLQYLKIIGWQLKALWKNCVQAPSQLKELHIFKTSLKEFPDFTEKAFLENGVNSSSGKAPMNGLEKLMISGETFVSKILISGIHCPILKSITLHGMENLMKLGLTGVNTLVSLDIRNCQKLKRLEADLPNLVLLNICQCPVLERITVGDCEHSKTVPGILNLRNSIELAVSDYSNNVTRAPSHRKLSQLNISACQELEDLEKITIEKCNRLKSVSGIAKFAKLIELKITDCLKLEFEYLCLSSMRCLENITFDKTVMVKYFELDHCQNLKTAKFSCESLVELRIRDCPELEEIPAFIGPSCLERIIIDRCEKFDYLELDGCYNLKSVSDNFENRWLDISDCPELEELPTVLIGLSLRRFRNLPRVAQFSGLMELPELIIRDCPELEELPVLSRMHWVEEIVIDSCEKLQSITPPTTVISLSVQSCRDLQRVALTGDVELTHLIIKQCHALGELPSLAILSCLEAIEVDSCEKLQNMMLGTTLVSLSVQSCRDLQRITGTADLTQLTELIIEQCPALEELPSLARVTTLKVIAIDSCEKLHEVSGIEDLHVSRRMKLCYCSNAVIRNCIHKLKCVPEGYSLVVGKAADGAASNLNERLFYDANIGVTGVIEIGTQETYPQWSELSTILGCFVVSAVDDINECDFNVRKGEWIFTVVAGADWSYFYLQKIEYLLRKCQIMRKGFQVEMKKGDEWKCLVVLRMIVDTLHHV